MGNIVNQVNTQTTEMADMLAEVGTTNAQIQAMITEAKVRKRIKESIIIYIMSGTILPLLKER